MEARVPPEVQQCNSSGSLSNIGEPKFCKVHEFLQYLLRRLYNAVVITFRKNLGSQGSPASINFGCSVSRLGKVDKGDVFLFNNELVDCGQVICSFGRRPLGDLPRLGNGTVVIH